MDEIVQTGDPVLRETARPVPEEMFGTEELSSFISRMTEALDNKLDGVALAAPQIGISLRIFIVRYDRTELTTEDTIDELAPDVGVFINPKIIKSSRKRDEMEEGCLSVQGVYGQTVRYKRASVTAQGEDGTHFTRGGGGILAQIFQHEIDHLNGILFIDHALNLYEIRKNNNDISHDSNIS